MLRINGFVAIRPAPGQESRVASLPYDVVTTDEARALAADNPGSFLHVVRSEIDLPPDTDPYADECYKRARENFDRLLRDGTLIRDEARRMFLYRLVRHGREQTGLVCCCHIDDYARGKIRKHELTRRAKEDDRTRHILTVNAHTGPVFTTYRDRDDMNELVKGHMNQRPLCHFRAPDDVTHTIWAVDDWQPYQRIFERMECAYVADGHHRAASASRAGMERRKMAPHSTGDEEYNWFLAAFFPAGQLTILPYNRVVRDLAGKSAAQVRGELNGIGDLAATTDPNPDHRGSYGVYLDGRWDRLVLDPRTIDAADPIRSLDTALLQERILEPVLEIGDPRTDDRIDFVGGIRGPEHLMDLVDSRKAAIAFTLYPTCISQVMAVADAGLVMPPKSTWFEPKLRSGLLVHSLD